MLLYGNKMRKLWASAPLINKIALAVLAVTLIWFADVVVYALRVRLQPEIAEK